MFNFFYYKQHIKAFKVREKNCKRFSLFAFTVEQGKFLEILATKKKLSDLIFFKNNLGFKMLALYQKSIVENNQVVFSLAF